MYMHVCSEMNYGGVESQMLALAQTLYENKDTKSTLFVALRRGGEIETKIRDLGFEVIVLNQAFKLFDIKVILQLRKLFKRYTPSILFLHGLESNLNGILASRFMGISKVIIEEIGITRRHPFKNLSVRSIYKLADVFTVQSRNNQDFYVSQGFGKTNEIIVVNPAIPKQKSCSPLRKEDKIIFFFVGRLEKIKGLREIIECFAVIDKLERGKEWALEIYGSGSQEMELKDLVKDLSLGDKVTFRGVVSSINFTLRHGHWIIVNSESEGFCLALVEAMKMGVPAITRRVGISEEIIRHGENGILLEDKSPQSLINGIRLSLSLDSSTYIKISTRARMDISEKFTGQKYLQELMYLANASLNE